MSNRREVKVGMKIDSVKGPEPFGSNVVNDLISKGWQVVELRPAGITFVKGKHENDLVQLELSGFEIAVVMQLTKGEENVTVWSKNSADAEPA